MQPVSLQETLARNIKYFRLERGYSQTGLASAIGCSRQWVSNVETGERLLNTGHIEMLAKTLDVEVEDLLVWHDLQREVRKGKQEISVRLIRTIV